VKQAFFITIGLIVVALLAWLFSAASSLLVDARQYKVLTWIVYAVALSIAWLVGWRIFKKPQ
jgi:hypothetical protein